ncbi:sensor histidine kinase [Geotalea toluenoxydans]
MDKALRLLIVDDSRDDAELMLHTLNQNGYETKCQVVDTLEAMRAALETEEWDIIFSDHAMPHFSAPEALAVAKELHPELPFIILSGEIDLNLAVSLMKGGAQDYIQKREMARIVPAIERELREVEACRQRRRMETALLASEIRYRRLFETAKDGILILDADTGKITDANPSLMEMLGCSSDELIGKKLWKTDIFADTFASKRAFNELEKKGYIRYDDMSLKTREGQQIDVEFISNVYPVDDMKVIQCNMRNITDRKRAEGQVKILDTYLEARAAELEAANSQLEAFNYTVSHDLRAPLTNINGYCQLLMELCRNILEPKYMGYLQEINNGVLRMNRLIDSLLNLSLVSRAELHREKVNLSQTAKAVAAELKLMEPQRKVTFKIADDVMVYGDVSLLQVVMENLFGNAWKYTSKRDLAHIEFGVTDHGGKRACYVRDNGAGFDMTNAEKLFNVFQRLDDTGEFEGFGIGLATVKRIIQSHGGWIIGEGEAGKGATFYFTLDDQLQYESINTERKGEVIMAQT